MTRSINSDAEVLKPSQFAQMLGCSVGTLQRWDRDGVLVANRTITNRRYYTYQQYKDAVSKRKKSF